MAVTGRPVGTPSEDRDKVDFGWLTRRLRPRRRREPAYEQLELLGDGEQSASTDADRAAGPQAPMRASRPARIVVTGAVVAYVWLFATWSVRHHDGFGTQAFDLGLYDQGVWLLSRFEAPFVTLMGRNLFGDHTSFVLLPLVPFYWVWPTASVLLIAQAAALGSAAVPVFLIAREKLRDEWFAAALAVAFLLQPALGWINLEQFHPDSFEVPLALFAAWFMIRQRWVGFLLCIGGLLLVKEDAFLLALGFGVYVFFKHDRRIGLATIGLSVLYAATAFWVVLPALNGVGTLNSWRIPFGGPWGFVRTSVTHPGEVVEYLLVRDRLWYGWQLIAPLAVLPLYSPSVLAIALLPLGANLVSTFLYQYDIHYHYSAPVVPILMLATIFSIARLDTAREIRRGLVIMVVVASVVTAYLWGPTPLGRREFHPADPAAAHAVSIRQAIRLIPEQAVLSSFYGWAPHADHRREIYMFPNPFKGSYWGTFEQEGKPLPQADRVQYVLLPSILDPEPKAVLDGIRADFDTVYEREGVLLLKRRG